MDMPKTVELLGRQHPVMLPSFAVREELAAAYAAHHDDGMLLRRVYGAIIGQCTTLGHLAGATLAKSRYDVIHYGGDVYSYLREQGATVEDVATSGASLLAPLMDQLFPREPEVEQIADFTAAAEGA